MKKRLIRITILIALIACGLYNRNFTASLFKSPTAYGVSDLTVDWGVENGNPIFNVNNFSPGEEESRTVVIHNDASTPKIVGVKAVELMNSGTLSDQLFIKIINNGTSVYGKDSTSGTKTLSDFFLESKSINGIQLIKMPANTSTNIIFKITFDHQSGNEHQNKKIIFDLKIGVVVAVPDECKDINLSNKPIYGTENNDTIIGTSGNDYIVTFQGNDVVASGGGDDCIVANEGNDTVIAGAGNDSIISSSGFDSIRGESGDDLIIGGDNIDSISGGSGNDNLSGNDDNDSIYGETGNDKIFGNNGNDSLNGGSDNDIIIGGPGIDSVNGSSGVDTCEGERRLYCEIN